MLKVVAICAVVFCCHLIVATGSDISDEDYLKNDTSVEEFTTEQPKVKSRAEDEEENQEEQIFCPPPPDVDGVNSPIPESEEFPVGTTVSYQCKFGYVSRSSGSLLSVCRINLRTGKVEWTHPNATCIPRSCGDPGYVVNGRRIGNLFTFPNKVKFECLEGYKLQGLKDRYCQANGEWSGRLPSCVPILCPVPSNPVNGRALYSSLEYGTELEYECDKGFMLQNQLPRICTKDGIWSNQDPECIETSCGIPVAPEHGSVQLSDVPKVGTLAFYTCDNDATLVGASTSKCLNSGDWTFDPPKCLRSCYVSDVQDGELGRYQRRNRYKQFVPLQPGEVVKHHEIVTLRCKDGYSPGNKTTGRTEDVECNDGKWSEPLYCHQMECNGEPPAMEYGSPRIGSRAHGQTIWYQCDPGYKRVKTGRVICKYGTWEGPTPVCADYRCYMKELDYPGLLKPKMNFINSGEHFNLICLKDYEVSTTKKLVTCVEGKWGLTENPCILKTCEEEPPSPNNGKPREFARINGSVVDYECDEGYEMVGNSFVHCLLGTWEGQPPDCELSMKNSAGNKKMESENSSVIAKSLNTSFITSQPEPEECFCTYEYQKDFMGAFWRNAEIESHDRIKKDERVLFICRYANMDIVWPNGMRFYEKVELTCDRCQDWRIQDLPHCEVRVSGDSFIAYHDQLKFRPGGIIEVPQSERITLVCINPWLQPKWNVTHRKRIILEENSAPVSQTGVFREDVIITKMDDEHIGRYECFAKHYNQKLRPAVIDLKMDGFNVLCPELSTETNQGSFEIVYSSERKVHSIARYRCKNPMKRIVGPNERSCLENGKWSHSYPACEDIRCQLLNGNNAFVITYTNSRRINSLVFYHCKSFRQRLIGSSNRTCLHSGEWSGTSPICEDITCPEFLTYNGLSVIYSRGRKVGSIASFNCLNHATLVGSPAASCQYNGTWSHPKPACEMLEIHCPKIDGNDIFTIKYSNDRRVNSTALFFCKGRNKKVSGCNFVTCQPNGEWSGDYPTCVDYVSCDPFATVPNLNVLYSDDGRTGSVATFQCLPPTILVGSSSARCLSNGTWNRILPICAVPNCTIEALEKSLPDAVYPNLISVTGEFVTPGSELPLICEEHLVLTGSSKALCNLNGKWEFADAQCISACRVNKDEASHLIVEPVKDYYRFGEFILLSCPPGQKLTNEVERMMCLGTTWSDTLPDCIETTEPNLTGSTQTTVKSG